MCVALYIYQYDSLLAKIEGIFLAKEEIYIIQKEISENVVIMLTTFFQNIKLKCSAR